MRNRWFFATCVCAAVFGAGANAFGQGDIASQRQLEIQSKALDAILGAADRICVIPPLEEHDSHLVLTGDAKAKLDGVLAKVATLGIEGAATYQNDDAKGIAHAKLAEALKDGNDCKLTVLTTLKSMIPKLTQDNPIASNSLSIELDLTCWHSSVH